MKVGQLKKILQNYSDDLPIKVTYECDDLYRRVDNVVTRGRASFLIIESCEVPDVAALAKMANSTLEKYGDDMNDREYEIVKKLAEEYS